MPSPISDSRIAAFLPNSIQPAPGEKSLAQKLDKQLTDAHHWIGSHILGTPLPAAGQIYSLADFTDPYDTIRITDALASALASLDIVITPNGLATVSTSNLAPASKARADALRQSLLQQRDRAVRRFVDVCMSVSITSPGPPQIIARAIGGPVFDYLVDHSIFRGLELLDYLDLTYSDPIDELRRIRPSLDRTEKIMKDLFFPEQTWRYLCNSYLRSPDSLPLWRSFFFSEIERLFIHIFKNPRPVSTCDFIPLANRMKEIPVIYPSVTNEITEIYDSWINSPQARYYDPIPTFKNRRDSPGYFF
ncbi:MAG: hypothetical protein HDS14_06015 [Bacteroides sp.]|nr:hypothetical protein [Bacteroides sp.]